VHQQGHERQLADQGSPATSRSQVDEKEGSSILRRSRSLQFERHLYSARLSTGLKRISKENWTHTISFSNDGRFYFDVYSNARLFPPFTAPRRRGEVAPLDRPGLRFPHNSTFSIRRSLL